MRTDLITAALLDAAATRGSLAGAVFHADHGAQYTSRAYAELCRSLGVMGFPSLRGGLLMPLRAGR
jgi:transposase InsO family protein